jgi:hypothetical protein
VVGAVPFQESKGRRFFVLHFTRPKWHGSEGSEGSVCEMMGSTSNTDDLQLEENVEKLEKAP